MTCEIHRKMGEQSIPEVKIKSVNFCTNPESCVLEVEGSMPYFLTMVEDVMSLEQAAKTELTDPTDGHKLTPQEIVAFVSARNRDIRDSIRRAQRAAKRLGIRHRDRFALLQSAALIRATDLARIHAVAPEEFIPVRGAQ
jgi:hypothetical protein